MRRLAREKLRSLPGPPSTDDGFYPAYQGKPVEFCRDVLGIEFWDIDGKTSQLDFVKAVAKGKSVAVRSGHKVGKLLHPDTPIPTPTGWRRYGDLSIGDELFSDTGEVCRVTGEVHWKARPLLRVHFEDGTYVDADERHEWVVRTRETRKRREKGTVTVETWQLRERLTVPNGHSPDGLARRIANFTVDTPGPLQLPERELPLDPYLLGAWLGDGTSRSGGITSFDGLEQAFADHGFEVRRHKVAGRHGIIGLEGVLRRMGLLGNKRVPEEYLWASEPQRLALLQGLMDTDGYCSPRARAQFCNTNRNLAESVLHLARSLGIKARIREKRAILDGRDIGPKWHVEWSDPLAVFRLPRKLARLRTHWEHKRHAHGQMAIVAVEPVGTVDSKCIEVDSPSHLYLCGDSMLPTHNSTALAAEALWFYSCYEEARVIFTAPTHRQVERVLWREVRKLVRRAKKPLAVPASGVPKLPNTGLESPDGRELWGFTTDDPDKFSGISGANVLYLVDEASGVEEDIFEAIEGNRAGGAILVLTGNPTQTSGKFYDVFHGERRFWDLLHIDSRTPAISGLGIPGLATKDWVEEREEAWGTDSPIFDVRVSGNFPRQATNAVISLTLLEASQDRYIAEDEGSGEVSLGVDVARFGDDETIIQPVRGFLQLEPVALRSMDNVEIAGKVLEWIRDNRPGKNVIVNVDETGVGAGVVDILKRHRDKCRVRGIETGRRSDDETLYKNLRAQLHFALRDWMADGGIIRPDPVLEGELVAPTYTFDAQGRYVVESKDKIKERIHHSPDRMDALSLAVYRKRKNKPPKPGDKRHNADLPVTRM